MFFCKKNINKNIKKCNLNLIQLAPSGEQRVL